MSFVAALQRSLDWWIPPTLRSPFEQHWRARLLVQLVAAVIVSVTISCAVYVVRGYWIPLAVGVFVDTLMIGTLWALRRTGAFRLCVLVPLVLSGLAIAIARLFDTPLEGAGLSWFAALPLGASLLLGRRAALGWALAATAAVLALWFRPGVLELGHAAAPALVFWRALMVVALLVVMAALAVRHHEVALAEVQRVDRAKSNYLALVSHELLDPLKGILAVTEDLARSHGRDADTHDLTLLCQSARELDARVRDAVDLTELETGALKLELHPFKLQDVLTSAIEAQRERATAKGLELTLRDDTGLPDRVLGDPGRLATVLRQLLDNAVKYTERGAVTVTVERAFATSRAGRPAAALRVTVRDTGLGFPRELLRNCAPCDPRSGELCALRERGAGMGLALACTLVARMGTRLKVSSVPGAGTVVSFELQVAPPDEATPTPSPQQTAQHVER